MDFLRDLWGFLKHRKKFWLVPLLIILLALGLVAMLTSGSPLAVFIYTIF